MKILASYSFHFENCDASYRYFFLRFNRLTVFYEFDTVSQAFDLLRTELSSVRSPWRPAQTLRTHAVRLDISALLRGDLKDNYGDSRWINTVFFLSSSHFSHLDSYGTQIFSCKGYRHFQLQHTVYLRISVLSTVLLCVYIYMYSITLKYHYKNPPQALLSKRRYIQSWPTWPISNAKFIQFCNWKIYGR